MTDKLRDAAQQALKAVPNNILHEVVSLLEDAVNDHVEGGNEPSEWLTFSQDAISKARAAIAQQDAQAVPQGWVWDCCIHSKGGWKVIAHFDVPIKVGARLNAAPTPPAQAVMQEPCAVVKWQIGGPVVHIIGDVQVGDLLYRAAPTPPAQRVMLTDEEIIEMCDYQGVPDAQGECLVRAAIDAYERKNGIEVGRNVQEKQS